jgi:hypothetical protein
VLSIPQINSTQLTEVIGAIGALGTAAFGLVDATKAFAGGVSRAGFKFIRQAITQLAPSDDGFKGTALDSKSIATALFSQWINGTAEKDQVNIAKSLIKLRLTPGTAAALATTTGVDPVALKGIAAKMVAGNPAANPLTQAENDIYGRFDLLLTTMLDQAYQRADQRYRNCAKAAAVPVAIILAIVANCLFQRPITWAGSFEAVLIGLIATPIAPVAKDLASAIQTASQTMQAVKRV